MTADDYTFITLKGELRGKADIVKGFASGSSKYQSRSISDLKIRVYGEVAIVTGTSVQEGTEDGKDYSGNYRFTRASIKQNRAWKTVALHTMLIQHYASRWMIGRMARASRDDESIWSSN